MTQFASARRFCSGSTLAALTLAAPAISRAQAGYTILDLGSLGGTNGAGFAINASGQVAGFSETTGNAQIRAARWNGIAITDLGTNGGGFAQGNAINASGQIAGNGYLAGTFYTHALFWTGTTATDLGTLGGLTSFGEGINDSGQVAGYSDTANGFVKAVRWTGTTPQALNSLGGSFSQGLAINASGQMTGLSGAANGAAYHAVIWNGVTPTDLGTLGGPGSAGYSINASGQIAGYSNTKAGNTNHAVRWTGTFITDLGTLGGTDSEAYSINRSGAVVGQSFTADGVQHAFYAPGSAMVDLNTLLPANSGWTLLAAYGISDNGLITGQGIFNDRRTAFVLRPITASVSGSIALEGVASLNAVSPAAPLGTFHIGFRRPGATSEIYGADVTLTTTPRVIGGTYTIPNAPVGAFDISVKGAKNLRVVLPNQVISGTTALPSVTLPAGDSNNDNAVDPTDFGIFVGAYNTDSAVANSGYDPTCDFNFDGAVDAADFGLFVGEYGNAGAP